MKNFLRNRHFLIVLVVVTPLLLFQCQDDENISDDINQEQNFELTTKKIDKKVISQNTQLIVDASKLLKDKSETNRSGNTTLNLIDTQALYIEAGDYHSYTFKVDKEEELPLQNITFSLTPEGSYRAFLVTYDFTQEELEAIHNGIPVGLNLEDKTIIEDIDLNSNDFFNRSASRSCSTITIQSCITTQDCDQGGSTHTAGDACIANGNANDPSTVCVPVSIITSCGQNTNGDGTDNSGGGGGGGADSQADTDDAVEETVPCDSLPEGQGIEIGNGLCIVPDSGLTGPLISIDLNNNNQQDPEPRTIEEICEDIAE